MANIQAILSQVKELDSNQQFNLLEKLVLMLRKNNAASDIKLSAITGVGSEIWSGTDIDKYIDTEREW